MSTGELFTWGLGEYGRLGHGDNQTQLRPKQVRCAANRNGLAVLYTEPFGLLPQTLRSTTGTTALKICLNLDFYFDLPFCVDYVDCSCY